VLLGVGLLVLVVALAGFVWAGPLLVVRHVEVRGVTDDRAAQVRTALATPWGEPLARVDGRALAGRVRQLPFVASVDVSRGWPRTLVVTVDARTPRAVVPVAGGGYDIVDGEGVAYARADKAPKGLPVVRLGDDAVRQPTLVAALQVLQGLPEGLRDAVTSVKASSPDAVTLTISRRTVVWGSPEQTDRKARIFEALRDTKAKVYDVSSPDTPVLR
jgi:cell division protein FtsQ